MAAENLTNIPSMLRTGKWNEVVKTVDDFIFGIIVRTLTPAEIKLKCETTIFRGTAQMYLGNYQGAQANLELALGYAKRELNSPELQLDSLSKLIELNLTMSIYQPNDEKTAQLGDAEKYHDEGLNILEKVSRTEAAGLVAIFDFSVVTAKMHIMRGKRILAETDFVAAKGTSEQLDQIGCSDPEHKGRFAQLQHLMAKITLETDSQKASQLYQDAYNNYLELGDVRNVGIIAIDIGDLYARAENIPLALWYYRIANVASHWGNLDGEALDKVTADRVKVRLANLTENGKDHRKNTAKSLKIDTKKLPSY